MTDNNEHTPVVLTEEQINHIADKAATRALEIVYADVGRNVLKKLAWLIGVVAISLALFLAGKGALNGG